MYKKLVIQNSTYISNNYWAFVLRPFLKNKSPILSFRQGLYLTGLSFSVRMFYHRCIPKEIMRGHNKVVMNWAVLVSASEVKRKWNSYFNYNIYFVCCYCHSLKLLIGGVSILFKGLIFRRMHDAYFYLTLRVLLFVISIFALDIHF